VRSVAELRKDRAEAARLTAADKAAHASKAADAAKAAERPKRKPGSKQAKK
jgi:hypothetical protein